MIMIMQNYGEIVVCIGSSASCSNVDTFLQADCAIAIEPLQPQVGKLFKSIYDNAFDVSYKLFQFS